MPAVQCGSALCSSLSAHVPHPALIICGQGNTLLAVLVKAGIKPVTVKVEPDRAGLRRSCLRPQQVVLSLQAAVTGLSEVVPLAGRGGVQPFFTTLTQQPADIAGQLLGTRLLSRAQLTG